MIASIGSITFTDQINQHYSSKRATKDLVMQAQLLIRTVSSSPKFQPLWLRRFGLDLEVFLRTMLECALTASSRRYVASAIMGCGVEEWNNTETEENLRELAINWFGHLFWVFKSAGVDGMYLMNDEILDHFIREEVIQRDGNRCLVTGVYDWHRAQRHQVPKASLDYACILPRTARPDFPPERSIHKYFSATSWDILQNYVLVTIDDEEQFLDQLESSVNAIAMELDACHSFQQFLFSLEPSQMSGEYVTVIYEHAIDELCAIPPRQDKISLNGTSAQSSNIPTPSRLFLQIHANIANVLYHSGGGTVIDRINDFLGPNHPVLRRLDFDSARVTLEFGESVERMFSVPSEKKRAMGEDETPGKYDAHKGQESKRRRKS
ncbi:hypothetical protein AX15_000537 [Amanita polypyramis BW_CC]|nr:hypothetical protein AX15_000537 [Amanita polypyramis BW_CC]